MHFEAKKCCLESQKCCFLMYFGDILVVFRTTGGALNKINGIFAHVNDIGNTL